MSLLTRDRKFYREFFSLIFFIAFQNLIVYAVNLADNVMLGSFNEASMTGVTQANQVQFLLQMVVNGVGEGVVVLSSQYWGRRETQPIRRITAIGMRFSLAIGLLFMAVAMLFPEWIMGMLCGDETEVIRQGVEYLRIISLTYIFFSINTCMLAAHRSVENVSVGLLTSVLALVTNVGLNYMLIFGNFGAPRLGVKGAAIATLCARMVETLAIFIYTYRDKKLGMRFQHFLLRSRELSHDFVKAATPIILSGASWGIAMFIQGAVLGRLGAAAMGANSIAGSLFSIISVVAYGASSAAAVFTGKTVGMGDRDKLKEYVKTMQVLFLIIGVISGVALFLSREAILSLYDVAPETQALAREFIGVLSITLVGTAYQVACLTGIVRGGGHTKFVFYNDLIFMWCIVLPLSLLGAFVWNLPPTLVFFFLKMDQILKCFVAVFEVNSYRWVRKLTRDSGQTEVAAP